MRDIIIVVIVVILQFCHLVKGCLAFVIFVIESGEIVIFVIRQQGCCGTGSLLTSGQIFP